MVTCKEAADFLVERFYEYCPRQKFTPEAQEHVRRLAEYTICFAMECHYAGDSEWWDQVGRPYWLKHLSKLHDKHLTCPTGEERISCKMLQGAVNDHAEHVKVLLRRAVRMGRFDAEGLGFGEGLVDREDRDQKLFELLSGCPFTVELNFFGAAFPRTSVQ